MKSDLNELKIKKNPKFDLIILDAMNVVKRFYAVMANFKDSQGRPTGILYGVLNYVHNYKKKFKGADIIVVWDTRAKKKKEIDSDYKGNRLHEERTDFWDQVRELKIALSFYGIRQMYAEGYEADDVAAKIVKENKSKLSNILLDSNDNDWDILLDKNVYIIRKHEILSKQDIQKTYEYNINKQTLVKSIIGEGGDNIKPIIKRIPKKLVYEMINDSDDIDDILYWCQKNDDNKWCKGILERDHLLKTNYKLASMITEGYEIEEIKPVNNKKQLIHILKNHDMKKLCERITNE